MTTYLSSDLNIMAYVRPVDRARKSARATPSQLMSYFLRCNRESMTQVKMDVVYGKSTGKGNAVITYVILIK